MQENSFGIPTIDLPDDIMPDCIEVQPPFKSHFGRMTWRDTFGRATAYSWLVEGLIPDGDAVLLYGAPQTAKTFVAYDLAMCVARGLPFFGKRSRRAGVIYCAFEGGRGFGKRQLAYALDKGITADVDMPIEVLTHRADLFGDRDFDPLCVEMTELQRRLSWPLGLIVIDTFAACTPGADENSFKDISKVRQRFMALTERFHSTVLVVHHKPAAGGKPRGHGSLTGDFETTIDVDWVENGGDEKGRRIRKMYLTKQREDDTTFKIEFVLKKIEVGHDQLGQPITSCVIEPPTGREHPEAIAEGKRIASDGRVILKDRETMLFRGLVKAISSAGRRPDDKVGVEATDQCVTLADWRKEDERLSRKEDETDEAVSDRCRKAVYLAAQKFVGWNLIGKDGDWVWRTGRKVMGIDHAPRPKKDAVAGEVTSLGESEF